MAASLSLPRLRCVVLLLQRKICDPSKLTEPAVPPAPKSASSFEFAALVLRFTFKLVPVFKLKLVEPIGADWSTPP